MGAQMVLMLSGESRMTHLDVRLFGFPQIFQHNTAVHIERRKALALLAFLAVTGYPQSRETLSTLLWPEHPPEFAYADLRRMLSLLRHKLGANTFESDRETISISSGAGVDLDIARLRSLLNRWYSHFYPLDKVCLECLKSVSEAVATYIDPFMNGFSLPDSPEFDAWQRLQRQALQDEMVGALDWLAEQYGRLGRWEQAAAFSRRRLFLDPLDEPAYVRLMQYYARAGQHSAVRRQFKECERVLREELGVPPQAETLLAYQSIFPQGVFPGILLKQ
jgi:DNA-binding SARP family transcriptional activator